MCHCALYSVQNWRRMSVVAYVKSEVALAYYSMCHKLKHFFVLKKLIKKSWATVLEALWNSSNLQLNYGLDELIKMGETLYEFFFPLFLPQPPICQLLIIFLFYLNSVPNKILYFKGRSFVWSVSFNKPTSNLLSHKSCHLRFGLWLLRHLSRNIY